MKTVAQIKEEIVRLNTELAALRAVAEDDQDATKIAQLGARIDAHVIRDAGGVEGLGMAPEAIAPIALSAFATAMTIGRLFGDRFRAWWGDTRLIAFGGLISTAGMALALVMPGPYIAIAGFFLFLSGLIAGYYDNKALYTRMGQRVRQLRRLRSLLGTQRLENDDFTAFPFGCSSEGNFDRFCSDGTFDYYDFRSENEKRRQNAATLNLKGKDEVVSALVKIIRDFKK